jgi:hypothetical protein
MKKFLIIVFALTIGLSGYSQIVYKVTDYGVTGNAATINTDSIQSLINKCSSESGGTLFFPAGKYLTGTIVMLDNVTLHLAPDAVLLGSKNLIDYKLNDSFLEEKNAFVSPKSKALILAFGSSNISITGQGTIDGQGQFFEAMSRQESIPVFRGEAKAKKIYPGRPKLIEMVGCNNINIKSIQAKNSPGWGIHLIGCESVFIDQLQFDSHVRPNNDGIDIESCKTVFISNSSIYSDDDAICFKSSIEGLPVENVVVTNCIIRSNCAAIKFGTPSVAGFKNISVSNCAIYDCAQDAIKFMAVDGGIVEDINISNITMHNVEGPIFMRLGNRARKDKIKGFEAFHEMGQEVPPVGIMRNIRISGITATMKTVIIQDSMLAVAWDKMAVLGIMITGIPGHYIEDVTFNDIQLIYPGGGSKQHALITVPENEDMYPEQHFFGILPSYGAYIRHAKGIVFNNVRFKLANQDFRPAIVTNDVENLELINVSAEVDKETESLVRMIDTRDVLINACRSLTPAKSFLKLEGDKSGDILMLSNDFRKISKPFIVDDNVNAREIVVK